MTELQEKLVQAVQDAGGQTDWLSLMAGLDYPEQQRALSEIRALETQGKLKRTIAWDAVQGTVSFTVESVG